MAKATMSTVYRDYVLVWCLLVVAAAAAAAAAAAFVAASFC
jgi:hypothetical protein